MLCLSTDAMSQPMPCMEFLQNINLRHLRWSYKMFGEYCHSLKPQCQCAATFIFVELFPPQDETLMPRSQPVTHWIILFGGMGFQAVHSFLGCVVGKTKSFFWEQRAGKTLRKTFRKKKEILFLEVSN